MSTGSEPKTVSLKTSDNKVFLVEEAAAMEFGTIKLFFDDNSDISDHTVVPLSEIKAEQLEKILEYCNAHRGFRAGAAEGNPDAFDANFLKELNNEQLKAMMLAADYLNVKELLEKLKQAVADRIKNKSVAYVRRFVRIVTDFTPAEGAIIRDQHQWAYHGVDPDDDVA